MFVLHYSRFVQQIQASGDENRLGISGTERFELFDVFEQFEIERFGFDYCIDQQLRGQIRIAAAAVLACSFSFSRRAAMFSAFIFIPAAAA